MIDVFSRELISGFTEPQRHVDPEEWKWKGDKNLMPRLYMQVWQPKGVAKVGPAPPPNRNVPSLCPQVRTGQTPHAP